MSKVFAIIPARGGSKRIPNKNIILINGVPMIGITIQQLLKVVDPRSIFVSTDSEQIISVSLDYGALCPFIRPSELSDDYTSTFDVIKHSLETLNSIAPNDFVMCVYPTAVLITPEIYRAAIEMIFQEELSNQFLISVSRYSHPIERAFKLGPNKRIEFLQPSFVTKRTQDLEGVFFDAGQFYIASKSTWLNSSSVFENGRGFEISRYSFVDVDYPEDLKELRRRMVTNDRDSYL